MNVEEVERQRQLAEVMTYCERLLQTAGVKEVYPTPVDRIVEAAELVKSGDLALLDTEREVLPQRLWRKLKGSITELVSIVRAGLFPKEKVIFINPNTPAASVPFATLHECVHSILPWQQKLYVYLDDDRTLDARVRHQCEREANFGGSYLLWQGRDYIKRALDMPITTATPVDLANLYGGSVHSSMRYYVENHREPLALLVFKGSGASADPAERYHLLYPVTSQAFKNRFGASRFNLYKDDKSALLKRGNILDVYWEGELYMTLAGELQLLQFFGYETPYNLFIILTPKKVTKRYGMPLVIVKTPAPGQIQ